MLAFLTQALLSVQFYLSVAQNVVARALRLSFQWHGHQFVPDDGAVTVN